MKRFLTVLILLLALPPLVLSFWVFGLPPAFDESFMGELKYKTERLKNTEGPRIILLGGSAAAFGVSTTLLEEDLPGFHAVNYGMYAALGTTVMLDLSLPLIRPGDLVVLMPEQNRQTLSDYFDPAIFWQGADGYPALLSSLSGPHLLKTLAALPSFAGLKVRTLLSHTPLQDSVYLRTSFDSRCDMVSPLREGNIMEGGYDSTTPVRFDRDELDPDFLQAVAAYVRAVRERGADCVYMFCPVNALAVTGENTAESFCEVLLETPEVEVIGRPGDSVMDPGWFYDTNFHLNAAGQRVYTRLVSENLKAYLGDSRPSAISLPVMPKLRSASGFAGDDRDADCFVFEETDGNLAVSGLTDAGLAKASLTVPSSFRGQPVTRILEGAFAGSGLKEIVIQENIRLIHDGAFRDAPQLSVIRLLQERPACTVGQNLLYGTDARIYVSDAALSAYRTDYFFSPFANRILPESSLP